MEAPQRVWAWHVKDSGRFMPDIVLVAAISENGAIGRGNTLPWRLRSDMQHFRAVTMGKPVIMGRKTFLSIGKPLAGRTNIVVSRDPAFAAPGILVAPSIDAALAAARGDALRRRAGEIIVAGGAVTYSQVIPLAARIVVTYIHRAVEGDAYFPAIDGRIWQEVARDEHKAAAGDDADFAYITYERAS